MFQLARVAASGGNLEVATKCLGEALKCDPTNADYQQAYAEMATRLAAHAAIEEIRERGDKLEIAIATQHVGLGEAALARGDRDAAHHNFRKVMSLAGSANAVLQEMSTEREVAASEEDAEEVAKRERAVKRQNAQAYYQRGETARLAEDWDEALKCYEGALALDPGWPKYKEAVENARFEVRKREPLKLEPPEPPDPREMSRIRIGLTIGLLVAAIGYMAPQLVREIPPNLAEQYAQLGPFERLQDAKGLGWSATLVEPMAQLSHGERQARCTGIVDALPGPRRTLLLASADGYAVLCASEGLGKEVLTTPAEPEPTQGTLAEAD